MSRSRLVWDGRIVTEARFAELCETMHNEIATVLATTFIDEGLVWQAVTEEQYECAAGIRPCSQRVQNLTCDCA